MSGRSIVPLLAGAVLALSSAVPAFAQYSARVADGNRVGLTISNYGCFGNNFVSRSPSMEFPLGSGYEHLVNGGLWVGARATDHVGAFVGVTTAVVDISQGPALANVTEYTPVTAITPRSTVMSHRDHDPDAISELDHVTRYTDVVPKSLQFGVHRPLGIDVRQETYSWNAPGYADYQDVVFVRFVVANRGSNPLEDVWIGLDVELQSGDKNAYTTWPPSSGGSVFGSWYAKAWLEYDADLRLLREHRCAGQPVPDNCQLHVAPYWAGLKLLTPPGDGQLTTLSVWNWGPGSAARDEDHERHALLSAGTIADLGAPEWQPTVADPITLLAVGPFTTLSPGDSVAVDFAFLGGAEVEAIQDAARFAQDAYDRGYRDLVTAAAASLASARAFADRVELAWHCPALPGTQGRVERRAPDGAWTAIGIARVDGARHARHVDRAVVPGARYAYRLTLEDAEPSGEAWVDVPAARLAILSVRPATDGALDVELALPDGAGARLEAFDVAGRRLARVPCDGLAGGVHRVRIDAARSGVVYLRLARDADRVVTRCAVAR